MLSGCSDWKSLAEDWGLIKRKPVGTTAETMLQDGPGEFAGARYNEEKLREEIQDLPDQLSADEAYKELIYLLAEDYKPLLKDLNRFQPQFHTTALQNKRRTQKPKHVNLAIVFDSSQMMFGRVNDQWKLNLEKIAIGRFASSYPEESTLTLRGFGGQKQGATACRQTRLATPQSFGQFKPIGPAALAQGLRDAGEDLSQKEKAGKNMIVLITGGIETCGGDPVREAKALHDGKLKAEVHVIGFFTSPLQNTTLKKIAQAGGGKFTWINSAYSLENVLREKVDLGWEYYVDSWKVRNVYALSDFQTQINEKVERLTGLNPFKSQFYQLNVKEKQQLQKGVELLFEENKIDAKLADPKGPLYQKINRRYDLIKSFYEQKYREKKRLIDREIQEGTEQIDQMYLNAKNIEKKSITPPVTKVGY